MCYNYLIVQIFNILLYIIRVVTGENARIRIPIFDKPQHAEGFGGYFDKHYEASKRSHYSTDNP